MEPDYSNVGSLIPNGQPQNSLIRENSNQYQPGQLSNTRQSDVTFNSEDQTQLNQIQQFLRDNGAYIFADLLPRLDPIKTNFRRLTMMLVPTDAAIHRLERNTGRPINELMQWSEGIDIIENHLSIQNLKSEWPVFTSVNDEMYGTSVEDIQKLGFVNFSQIGDIQIRIIDVVITNQRQLDRLKDAKTSMVRLSRENFRNIVELGQLSGKDLIGFCLSSPAINTLCDKQDEHGRNIFNQLVEKEFKRQVPKGESAREYYIELHTKVDPARPNIWGRIGVKNGIRTLKLQNREDMDYLVMGIRPGGHLNPRLADTESSNLRAIMLKWYLYQIPVDIYVIITLYEPLIDTNFNIIENKPVILTKLKQSYTGQFQFDKLKLDPESDNVGNPMLASNVVLTEQNKNDLRNSRVTRQALFHYTHVYPEILRWVFRKEVNRIDRNIVSPDNAEFYPSYVFGQYRQENSRIPRRDNYTTVLDLLPESDSLTKAIRKGFETLYDRLIVDMNIDSDEVYKNIGVFADREIYRFVGTRFQEVYNSFGKPDYINFIFLLLYLQGLIRTNLPGS